MKAVMFVIIGILGGCVAHVHDKPGPKAKIEVKECPSGYHWVDNACVPN